MHKVHRLARSIGQHNLDSNQLTVQTLLDSLGEGVIVADVHGKFLFFNLAAERILGIGSMEILPDEWSAGYGCYLPDQNTPYPADQLPLARSIRGEKVLDELIFIKNTAQPDGVWINISSSPITQPTGQIEGGVVIFRDVSEQQKIRDQNVKLASAVEQTADSIFITDRHGIIQYVNPGFESTTGYTREEVLGQTPRILKSGKQGDDFYQQLWQRISQGKHFRATVINKKRNGDLFWAEQTITPLIDAEGQITSYVSVLKDITELREKQEQDIQLAMARQIQQKLYPQVVQVPGFDIAGRAFPADGTGGDCFDYISTPEGDLWIAVGDVSGHGISSALIMAETRAFLRAFVQTESDPRRVLDRVNRELATNSGQVRFVTMILVRLNPTERSLIFANAGHTPGYLLSESGDILAEMKTTGIPLGILPDYEFKASDPIHLSPGDSLALMTDGVIEARTDQDEEFGLERAVEILKNEREKSANEIINRLVDSVRNFGGDRPQEDDITIVVCKVNRDN